MNRFMLVVQNNADILRKISNRTVIVKTDRLDDAVKTFNRWNRENRVFCLAVNENRPLSAIKIRDDLINIPIALYITEIGSFKKIISRINTYKKFNLRIFMPSNNPKNVTKLQILSSLGVYTGLNIEEGTLSANWDRINDLMHYSVYSRANHTPIEPFAYTVSHFEPRGHTFFKTPYFENPHEFLYIDAEQNIALSAKEIEVGEYIAHGIDSIDSIQDNKNYQKRISEWQDYFLENKQCAYCPAWRICHGNYFLHCEKDENAFHFFNDLLEAAVSTYANKNKANIWQL